jgi:hypothetical protein
MPILWSNSPLLGGDYRGHLFVGLAGFSGQGFPSLRMHAIEILIRAIDSEISVKYRLAQAMRLIERKGRSSAVGT